MCNVLCVVVIIEITTFIKVSIDTGLQKVNGIKKGYHPPNPNSMPWIPS